MAWNKVLEQRLPTARGRTLSTLSGVDRHLSQAQAALATGLGGDPELKRIHDEVYDEIEKLRRRVGKMARFQR